jgi:hypothetical protein
MNEQIRQFLAGILEKMDITDAVITVETPENVIHGDYTTNVAMTLAGRLNATPMKIAQQILDLITTHQKKSPLPWLSGIQIAPPGFINFFLSEATFSSKLVEVLEEKERYGQTRYTSFTQGERGKITQKSHGSTPQKSVPEKSGKKPLKSTQKQQLDSRANNANAGKALKKGICPPEYT